MTPALEPRDRQEQFMLDVANRLIIHMQLMNQLQGSLISEIQALRKEVEGLRHDQRAAHLPPSGEMPLRKAK